MARTSPATLDRGLRQLSLDDLGTPLCDVTFCVLDLETTGGTARGGDSITEVGAVRYRGGERIGTFQTLVNPGSAIPPYITYLTGITEAMVAPAPPIEAVLPSLHEFIGDSVIVGHNVRFDLSFLRASAVRLDYDELTNRVIDTCSLARRLVRDEVVNCKLGTLAERFGLPNRPNHRALDDALATADLLHLLLERAAGLGVLGLDDLLELPTMGRHPMAAKLKLTNALPRSPGVYVFRGAGREILYVGKATNLRARVRSYFGSDDRRKIGPLLNQTFRIDHLPCATEIEAAAVELRTIQRHLPPFNRVATRWTNYAYLRLDDHHRKLRIVATRRADPGAWHVGPFPSLAIARLAAEACRASFAELGVVDGSGARRAIDSGAVFSPLSAIMQTLARAERFEAAAAARDRAGALARAVQRQHRIDALRTSGRVEWSWGTHRLVSRCGLLEVAGARFPQIDPGIGPDDPIPRELSDELACFTRWLDTVGARSRIVHAEHPVQRLATRIPRFAPVGPGAAQTVLAPRGRRPSAFPPRPPAALVPLRP